MNGQARQTGRFALIALTVLLSCVLMHPGPATAGNNKDKKKRTRKNHRSKGSLENLLVHDWLFELREETRSSSQGQANGGKVDNGCALALKGRSWQFINSIGGRKTNYGTEPLVRLLETTADAMADKFPGSILEIGNIGKVAGGKITQSKSHQGGRDVDVAFFAMDEKGRRRRMGRFRSFDSGGKAKNGWTLDVERNWELVKLLIESEDPVVQWMFISAPVKELLLAHARETKEPAALIRRASVILHQPGDSSAHADHYHVRIYCTAWDLAHGCRDYGPLRSHLERDKSLLAERIERFERRAQRGKKTDRFAAIGKLAELAPDRAKGLVGKLLCDADATVVREGLNRLRSGLGDEYDQFVASKLSCAGSNAGLLVLLDEVLTYRDKQVWKASMKVAKSKTCTSLKKCDDNECKTNEKLCSAAAAALGFSGNLANGSRLVALAASESGRVSRSALRALKRLCATADPIAPGQKRKKKDKAGNTKAWNELLAKFKNRSWGEQTKWQLKRQGYKLGNKLFSMNSTEALLNAAKAGFPVSYSAQVVLADLYKVTLARPMQPKEAYRFFRAHTRRQANGKKPSTKAKHLPPLPD